MESNDGFKFHGCSSISDIGQAIIAPQIRIDAVTFSFFLLLIFNVKIPPIT